MGADGGQDEPVTGSRSLVSRRSVLRAAGAAGAAVWVAPVVESFTSYAVAGSAPTTALNFGCSWVYVVWKHSSSDTVYYTGWTGETSTACGSESSYPLSKSPVTTSAPCTGYTMTGNHGVPPTVSYSGTPATYSNTGCDYFTYSGTGGRTIQASAGTTILAAFSFGGKGGVNAICPNTTGSDNTLKVTCSGQKTISTAG